MRASRLVATVARWCSDGRSLAVQLGIFAIFPLVKVAVIRANDGSHELTEHAASRGKLPISLEDE